MKKIIIIMISIFFIGINIVYAKETVKFSKCVDGDTFKVTIDDKEYTIRMLAIDTPESVKSNTEVEYYGKESSEYTCKKLTNAKKIELEYDSNSDKLDKYDRLLAWVFVDDKLLQEELVTKGYAKVAYLYNDYKYTNILQEKQELASAKSIGIWDSTAKREYEQKLKEEPSKEKHESIEIIVVTIIFLIITFITSIINKIKK